MLNFKDLAGFNMAALVDVLFNFKTVQYLQVRTRCLFINIFEFRYLFMLTTHYVINCFMFMVYGK